MSLINFFIKTVEANGGPTAGKIKFNNPIKAESISVLIEMLLEVIVKIGAAVVVMMVIYSGFLFVAAQGDPAKLKTAKNTFLWTVIGGVILLGAQAIAILISRTAGELGVGL